MSEASSFSFETAIGGLEKRAKSARFRGKVTIAILVTGVLLFSFFATSYIQFQAIEDRERDKSLAQLAYRSGVDFSRSGELLENRLRAMLEKVPEGGDNEWEQHKAEVSNALPVLRDLSSLDKEWQRNPPQSSVDPITSAIQSSVISIGLVGIAVFLIQICMSFIRYYTQLAELYEAQADALRASGNNMDAAIAFMDKFSPASVSLGKAPSTIYEKALEAVRDVAKRPPATGN